MLEVKLDDIMYSPQHDKTPDQIEANSTGNATASTTSTRSPSSSSSATSTSLAASVLSRSIDFERCKVVQQPAPSPTSPAGMKSYNGTIVTAYFPIRAKHGRDAYTRWMTNMLSVQDPMVIFTCPEMVGTIRDLRGGRLDRTLIVEMELDDLPIAQLTGPSSSLNNTRNISSSQFWERQLKAKDPEGSSHRTYEVFWIWLSKTWWVVQAIKHYNMFESQFFMWCDIGSFRDDRWNNKTIIRYPEIVPSGTILWMSHNGVPNPHPTRGPLLVDKFRYKKHFYHSGSQGAGTSSSWLAYHNQFAKTIDRFLISDYFIGEDQTLLQAACLQAPKLCAYVPPYQVNDGNYFGVRYVLHSGPNSAIDKRDKDDKNRTKRYPYEFWRPPGWDAA